MALFILCEAGAFTGTDDSSSVTQMGKQTVTMAVIILGAVFISLAIYFERKPRIDAPQKISLAEEVSPELTDAEIPEEPENAPSESGPGPITQRPTRPVRDIIPAPSVNATDDEVAPDRPKRRVKMSGWGVVAPGMDSSNRLPPGFGAPQLVDIKPDGSFDLIYRRDSKNVVNVRSDDINEFSIWDTEFSGSGMVVVVDPILAKKRCEQGRWGGQVLQRTTSRTK